MIVAKESPTGKFQPSSENKKRLAVDSKIGSGISPAAGLSDRASYQLQIADLPKNGVDIALIGLLFNSKERPYSFRVRIRN